MPSSKGHGSDPEPFFLFTAVVMREEMTNGSCSPKNLCQAKSVNHLVISGTRLPQLWSHIQLIVHSWGGSQLWPGAAGGPAGHKGHLPYGVTQCPQLALRALKIILHQEAA